MGTLIAVKSYYNPNLCAKIGGTINVADLFCNSGEKVDFARTNEDSTTVLLHAP